MLEKSDLPLTVPAREPASRRAERDLRVDALRALGLLCIMLAHVDPPVVLFEVRNFDVPMMAFVSGIAYSLSRGKDEPFGAFLIKRFKRLVLPTWIFLTLYFAFLWARHPHQFPFSRVEVRSAFFLGMEFNYVWIIRVFLVLALISPGWKWLAARLSTFWILAVAVLMLGAGDAVYVLFRYAAMPGSLAWGLGVMAANVGFVGLFGVGFVATKTNAQQRWALMLFLAVIFVALFGAFEHLHHKAPSLQAFKYPPRLLYLAYGGAVSLLAWEMATRYHAFLVNRMWTPVVAFFSENSLWIYLWHILVLHFTRTAPANWALRYAVVLAIASALVAGQRRLVDQLAKRFPAAAKDLKIVLRG